MLAHHMRRWPNIGSASRAFSVYAFWTLRKRDCLPCETLIYDGTAPGLQMLLSNLSGKGQKPRDLLGSIPLPPWSSRSQIMPPPSLGCDAYPFICWFAGGVLLPPQIGDESFKSVGACPCGSARQTLHWTNAGLMLGQRLRRWPNIKPTLVQCIVFIGWGIVRHFSAALSFAGQNLSKMDIFRDYII